MAAQKPTTFQTFMERVPAFTALLTITIIVLAVASEAGFFSVVGREFQTLETASDYLNNAIVYMPRFLVVFAFSYVLQVGVRPLPSAPGEGLSRMDIAGPIGAFIGFVVLGTVTVAHGVVSIQEAIAYSLGLGWVFVVILFKNRVPSLRPVPVHVLVVPFAAAVICYVLGVWSANGLLKENPPPYLLRQGDATQAVTILRSFDRGLLAYDPVAGKVSFFPWESVTRIDKGLFAPEPSFLCRKVEWFCDNATPKALEP